MLVRAIFWAANSSVSQNQPISIVDVPPSSLQTPQSGPIASSASHLSFASSIFAAFILLRMWIRLGSDC